MNKQTPGSLFPVIGYQKSIVSDCQLFSSKMVKICADWNNSVQSDDWDFVWGKKNCETSMIFKKPKNIKIWNNDCMLNEVDQWAVL